MSKNFNKLKPDKTLIFIVLALLIYGLAVLYSSSTVESIEIFGTSSYYIRHQAIYGAGLGLIAMYILSRINYSFWQKSLSWQILGSPVLLFLVKVPGIGFAFSGAQRWIHIGPISLQPSEIAKLVIIFFVANWVYKRSNSLHKFKLSEIPSLGVVVLYAFLILSQPDFGTMLVLLLVAFCMLFASGIPFKYFFYSAVCGFLLLYALVKFEPYRAKRLTTFLDPSLDPKGIGYHINQAFLAIGSGGWLGLGYGLSKQKYKYLPEVMNDSIFAVFSEELGFLRVILAIMLFSAFAIKGFLIAKNAPDIFAKMSALGITCWISIQAIINMGAILNLVPFTGIPLPFFSYGGTALLVNLAAVGILLNISKFSQSSHHQ